MTIAQSVLVVEDSPLNARLMQKLLSNAGLRVTLASDAEIALKALEALAPALILTDIRLPGMSGLDLTRLLKADRLRCNIPVVAVTANDSADDRAAITNAGCSGLIVKPIHPTRFAAQVSSFVEWADTPLPAAPPETEFDQLRRTFLLEGAQDSTLLVGAMDQGIAGRDFMDGVLHRWIGCGDSAGIPEISTRARKLRDLLETRDLASLISEAQALRTLFNNSVAAYAA